MGYLLDGQWKDGWYDTASTGGEFVRPPPKFRNRVTADGSSGFRAEAGRYHLYVSLACPWAHRTLIFRVLKKLEKAISVSVVEPVMSAQGWAFSSELPDHVNGHSYLHEVYTSVEGSALLRSIPELPIGCHLIMDRAYEGDETRQLALFFS